MRNVKIGLLGLGNVGIGVWKILKLNGNDIKENYGYNLEVEKILVKNKFKKRPEEIPNNLITTKYSEIINNDEIDIIIEVIGGYEEAKKYIIEAIKKRKTVVTANKMLMAIEGEKLKELAEENGVSLYYEASVGGGIPIINSLKDNLSANKIDSIYGILNGTTNYILTKMQKENMTFLDALTEAKRLGYAESDPTSDIKGYDARYKLSVMSSLVTKKYIKIEDIYVEGIDNIQDVDIREASKKGYSIKPMAIFKNHGNYIEARVHPALISKEHIFSNINNSFNGVLLKGNAVGDLFFYGQGAGELPTGSAIVGDVILSLSNIEKRKNKFYSNEKPSNIDVLKIGEIKSKYYMRINVDTTDKVKKIVNALGKNYIRSIDENNFDKNKYITLITETITEKDIIKIYKDEINKIGGVSVENIIRIEDF